MSPSFRKQFDTMLNTLQEDYLNYVLLCKNLLIDIKERLAGRSFSDNDVSLEQLHKIKSNIEKECYKIFVHQQPIASDLATITVCIKSLYDITRVGEVALGISNILVKIDNTSQGNKDALNTLQSMISTCITMLDNYTDAYRSHDRDLSIKTLELDDKIDNEFDQFKISLINYIDEKRVQIPDALDLYMINKYIERCGDHISHMAKIIKSVN